MPEADGRERMVTLHYPASARHPRGRPARYATREEARLLLKGVPVEEPVVRQVARARTHSEVDVRPAPGRHPLMVLSPGFGLPRFTLH